MTRMHMPVRMTCNKLPATMETLKTKVNISPLPEPSDGTCTQLRKIDISYFRSCFLTEQLLSTESLSHQVSDILWFVYHTAPLIPSRGRRQTCACAMFDTEHLISARQSSFISSAKKKLLSHWTQPQSELVHLLALHMLVCPLESVRVSRINSNTFQLGYTPSKRT